jgi:hypothetical protein
MSSENVAITEPGQLIHKESYEMGWDDGFEDGASGKGSSMMLGLAIIIGGASIIWGVIGFFAGLSVAQVWTP